jgi:hypothetical protein
MNPQIFGPTAQNLAATATWRLGFVHPCVSGSSVFLLALQLKFVNPKNVSQKEKKTPGHY